MVGQNVSFRKLLTDSMISWLEQKKNIVWAVLYLFIQLSTFIVVAAVLIPSVHCISFSQSLCADKMNNLLNINGGKTRENFVFTVEYMVTAAIGVISCLYLLKYFH